MNENLLLGSLDSPPDTEPVHCQHLSGLGMGIRGVWRQDSPRHIGSTGDGIVGKNTIAAINTYRPQAELFGRIKQARYDFIDRICKKRTANNKFKNGWRNRIKDFKFEE